MLVAPCLLLQREDAGQREHDLRKVFNGLCYIVTTGAPWRWMPNDLSRWAAMYQHTQRWLAAGCFEALVDDVRAVLRLAAGPSRSPPPHVTPASAQDRGEVERLARTVQAVTDDAVEFVWVTRTIPASEPPTP